MAILSSTGTGNLTKACVVVVDLTPTLFALLFLTLTILGEKNKTVLDMKGPKLKKGHICCSPLFSNLTKKVFLPPPRQELD